MNDMTKKVVNLKSSINRIIVIFTLPHRRDWNFLGGGGSVRPKITERSKA